AERLITKDLPEKIIKLNEILETTLCQNEDLADIHQSLNIPIPSPADVNGAKRCRIQTTNIRTTIQGSTMINGPFT
ncbi:Proteasome subunit, partial [Operophtera brumata]